MARDCWSDDDYHSVLERVKNYLWMYVQAGASIEELENTVHNLILLEKRELDLLSIVHFLLSDAVKMFVESLPRILRRLSHSTLKEVIVNRGFVKGKIDWTLTLRERCAQGWDRTIFVCRPPSRIYNLPENQLLKYVLTQIRRLIEETSHLPQIEDKNIRVEELTTEDGHEKWRGRLVWLSYRVNNALKHAHLRAVDLPTRVTERMQRGARTARNKDYEFVENSFDIHRRIIQKLDTGALRALVEKRVLEPLERDKLYELFVLFTIMTSLGKPELHLIRPRAKMIGTYRVGEEIVHVYFQRVRGLLEESKYKHIFDDYELDVVSRRPDITLYFEKSHRFLIVEVKRTANRDYIVDSVYKVLGYLADFEKHFPDEQKPQGVLAVWEI